MRIALLVALALPLAAGAGEPDYARIFEGRDGCFALLDARTRSVVARSSPRRCALRTSPCSTFKVPLALMAFDAGILKDENSSLKWSGKDTGRPTWNRDHTATTWMQESVVWFSQRLTPPLGEARVRRYLEAFGFGNADLSGGLTTAWLSSSLLVSPDEELAFTDRLWRGDLPVSRHALETTRKITFVEVSGNGWTLHGKTGSCNLPRRGSNAKGQLYLGWFVGHVARGDREYVFVTSYTDRVPSADDRPPGWIARDMSRRILGELGVY